MYKFIQFSISLILVFFLQKLVAQTTPIYFDSKFKKVEDVKKAKYTIYIDTSRFQPVFYTKKPSRIYAKGKIYYDADSLTFDGKTVFEGHLGKLTSVRYYKNGKMLPLIFVDKNLRKKPELKAPCYMTISEKGYFYAYKIAFRSPDVETDVLFASGRVTDTITLKFDERLIEYDYQGYVTGIQKFKNGALIPFIESTLDIQAPHETMSVVTHSAKIYSVNDVESEHRKFIKKCRDTGADGVIGIKTTLSPVGGNESSEMQNVVIQGTTIRLINEKKDGSD